MVSPENPLTARVFVNRVWQWHFGEGIVRSVDDFGTQGAPPSHPELLDYLTVSFEEHNWDLKWLTKEIMLSQAYRQASTEVPQYMMADPSDKLLWRKAPVRLEAETIRDSMLQVSGLLNDKMFGKQEPIKRGPDGQWLEDDRKGSGSVRRSLYLAQTRTRSVAFLHVFDCPDMTSDNQAQRFRASLPTQSLALLNNPLVFRTTRALTQQVLERTNGNYDEAVKVAFDEAYSRPPSPGEMEIAKGSIAGESDPKEGCACSFRRCLGPTISCIVIKNELGISNKGEKRTMKRFRSRREILQDVAVGFGAMALNSILQTERVFGAESSMMPRSFDLKPKAPNFAAKAKNVIFIYIGGGPSTIDMFDPKPALVQYDGKPAPFEIKGRALNGSQQIMASPWPFTKYRPERARGLQPPALFPEGRRQNDVRPLDVDRSH